MAKKESTFLNMTLTLFIITAVAAVALGYVYNITKEPIQKAKDEKLKTAINIVVPGADKGTIEIDTVEIDGKQLFIYTVSIDDKIIGTAINSFSNDGFSGLVRVMVGFDSDGKIIDSDVLEHKETPGLGDKSSKSVSNWNERFKELDISTMKDQTLKVSKDGGEVDAITAATITSRAYCDAIQRAWSVYIATIDGNSQEKETAETEIIEENTLETKTDSIVEPNEGGNDNE